MDFCLMRIHTKFYISQILNSMKYIEYNNINYFIQEECKDIDEVNPQSILQTPKVNYLNSIVKSNTNEENNLICKISENNTDIDKEERILMEEIEKELQNNQDLFFTPNKLNENNDKKNDYKDITFIEIKNNEINDIRTNNRNKPNNGNIQESNLTDNIVKKENFFKKKFQLIESNEINELKYKKVFVYNNLAFSKVEIQGIIIDKKIYGYDEKNFRLKLTLDDSTGNIEVFAWRAKRENVFHKLRDEVNCGMILRILGTIDIYKDSFQLNLENFEIISNWNKELIFHKSLQNNQKALKKSQINNVLQLINNFNNKNSVSNNLNGNNIHFIQDSNTITENNTNYNKSKLENNKNYQLRKKDFANRILAFLKKYKLSDEIIRENNYIILKINSLISNQHFSIMMDDFCRDNNILDSNKFLIETFSLIEENSMGRLIEEDEEIEIRLDNEIENEILRMLKMKQEGLNYMDICDRISKNYNKFFTNDYIKYIIEDLIQNGKIQAIQQNFYQIMN